MKNDYYVYAHTRLSDGKCFNIGHGKKYRYKDGSAGRNQDWHDVVDEEGGYSWRILVSNITKEKAKQLEQDFIAQVGIETLTNRKSGPKPGSKGNFTGKKHSLETRKRISEANSIPKPWMSEKLKGNKNATR